MKISPLIFFVLSVLAVSCSRQKTAQVTREDLFSLDIGRMEDQIALYQLDGDRGIQGLDLFMRDGLFYISDGNGQKLVRYNSYGDLLFMIYNEETNPPPLTLRANIEDSNRVTRWAFPYPLTLPGRIVVDSRKHIYSEDRLPYERHSVDVESKALLDSVILHFDGDGRFIEYLGQEGIGGSPFPRIIGLYTSIHDELAVVCRLPTGWNIYWYSPSGTLLYLVQLKNEMVPIPPDWPELIPSVDSIAAAPDSRKLYLKVDYYRYTFDESTSIHTGNEADSSRVWIMNVEDGAWLDTIEVPFYEYSYTENERKSSVKMIYSLLGVAENGRIFCLLPLEAGYSVLILGSDSGSEQRQGIIQVNSSELQFNAFSLSREGILSALLADEWNVKVVWWRTDRMGSVER
ncbi:MAG: hypothetical protein LBR96_01700 [Treponema sp.]|jgi:hypothetical protein|nr:hypothetical protein [Treponema sp.]